jgi:hypothetical protein
MAFSPIGPRRDLVRRDLQEVSAQVTQRDL